MWRKLDVVLFILIWDQLDTCLGDYGNYSEDCSAQDCLRCSPKGCVKCSEMIVYPSRQCVDECPFGYHSKYSTMIDFMGMVCTHNGNFMGLSSNALTVLTGVTTGVVLCMVLFAAVILFIKFRRKTLLLPPQMSDTSSETADERPERKDFLKQLETLRPYASDFLEMLNDTRKQIRQQYQEGNNSATAAYKPVLRDLAKILILLNKPVNTLNVPEDWEHLFSWAEKTLKRYKRMSETSQPQVAQLISFLQSPIIPTDISEPDYSLRDSTTMSTFKPDQVFGSTLSLSEAAVKAFTTNYEKYQQNALNPQWKFEYSLVNNTPSEFNPQAWKNGSREYLGPLFLEDDFYQLGFRPQDEITTEL